MSFFVIENEIVTKTEDAENGRVIIPSLDSSLSSAIDKTSSPSSTTTTIQHSRRPTLLRNISHELEFTSFADRNLRIAKKNSVVASAPYTEKRLSLTDDLLKRAQLQRFFSSAKRVSEEKMIVSGRDPTSSTSKSKMLQKSVCSSESLLPSKNVLEQDEETEEEANSPTREVCSPSDVHISILAKDPDLTPWISDEDQEREQYKTMERRLDRARKLRRTTVMHYDQQEDTFRRRRAPQLFELAVLIDLELNDGSNEKLFPKDTYVYVPKISFVYPTKTNQNLQPLLATLPPLCYADLSRARPENPERYKDEQYLMIITDTAGDRKYAYCHRFVPLDLTKYASASESTTNGQKNAIQTNEQQSENALPQILCIVTPVNATSFYFDLTHEAALRAKSGNMPMLVTFLTQSFRHRLPPANGFVTVKLVDDDNIEESSEGADTGWEVVLINRTTPKKGQGLGELLDRLGVDRLMKLFCALLCEKRVLLVADSVPVLSRSVQAASTMLAPFEWPHTLIPCVADPLLHVCFSPAPYLMGVLRDHLPILGPLIHDDHADTDNQEEYMLILDLDTGLVLKDKEWATTTSSGLSIDLSISSPKLLPSRITRSLKQLLKAAMKSNGNTEKREQKATDAFQWTFVELVGHYREHIRDSNESGKPEFNRETFIASPTSRSQRNFLKWFVETGMYQVWINKKLDAWSTSDNRPVYSDVFDKKLDQLKAAASDSRGWSWARF